MRAVLVLAGVTVASSAAAEPRVFYTARFPDRTIQMSVLGDGVPLEGGYDHDVAIGLAEGGSSTVILVLIGRWFSRAERARAVMIFMISLPLSSVVANPISGALLGVVGWRLMFVMEAIPAFLWAFVWLWAVRDDPREAAWLPDGEQRALHATIAGEKTAFVPTGHWGRVMLHPFVVLLALYRLVMARRTR